MKISVIIPLYNGEQTIKKTLDSLFSQKKFFDEVIIVDDGSSDESLEIAKNFEVKVIEHNKNKGLAASYNSGIRKAMGEVVVFLHQDVILYTEAMEKIIEPFDNSQVVCAYHYVFQPFEIWEKYSFWQKYFFCRWVNKKVYGMNGKFDAFSKRVLFEAGLFDEERFKSAGEDGDIMIRLKDKGEIVKTEAGILHLHQFEKNFGFKDILYKQAQLSEAQGALYGKHGMFDGVTGLLKAFFREILLIGTLIPAIQIFSWIIIVFYCFFVSRAMLYREYKDQRTYLLPLVNFILFFVSFIYSIKGFLLGKQKI
ncbi:hypothetical protein A3B87_01080 [Candidatus Kuenenbacteria bacterium RIFCSPHIGHO2_02_FULL_39_13]|uniref:Glycosyltransferase 2-like domain-containing protein n=1 Tax=Candidatus Kuenenbacteria bacterium RIFCSPHIGHO2_02_FULL_39_13 TaxID=1798561 RepID=A0A1F6FMV0_9BACT|nr:MAG: hypothetical protein A3B87_01080 [Candidatus Kuenenbacteria bacterium RIFCSPHIGHO2_02_FULL_39_13]